MRAEIRLKETPHYRRDAFITGLKKTGYKITDGIKTPNPDDVLVIWNRFGGNNELARIYEAQGARVIVAENGYLGKDYGGGPWYAMSLTHHNGAGKWRDTGGARWKKHGFELKPYRDGGKEFVALPQRGIGPEGVAMPRDWGNQFSHPCRVRRHPGLHDCIPLLDDLKNAKAVVTWGSGAAIKALADGIPVFYELKNWIAKDGATHIKKANWQAPQKPDRELAFMNIFDAMWRLDEIVSGEAFESLCKL